MPTLNINGHSVNVDDSFMSLSHDQQNATVDEIAKSLPSAAAPAQAQPSLSDAVTDVPAEIGRTARSNLDTIQQGFLGDKGAQGPLAGTLATGKAMLAIPGLLASPITGAVRSLVGHPLAQATHAVGTVVNPQAAAQDDPQAMYNTAANQAETAMSAVAPRGFNPTGGVPMMPRALPPPSTADITAAAKQGFKTVTQSGASLFPTAVKGVASDIANNLQAKGYRDIAAPETHGILDELQNPPANSVTTIADLHEVRQALGKAAQSPDPREQGAASIAIRQLDKYLSNIPPSNMISGDPATVAATLKDAIGNYAAASRSNTVLGKLDRADLNASGANSGQNIDNATRQQIKTLLTNPKALRGYSAAEIAQMQKIVRGTAPGNVLRGVGNMMGGGGGLGAVISAGTGAYAAGPLGAVAPALGYGIKKIGNMLTARQAAMLDQMIRARSPLAAAQAPVPYMQSFGAPGTAAMGGLMSASAPRALFPFLNGPVPAYANQNQ